MLPPDQRPKVTLEDLLRLKRTEQPTDDFWVGFERELRQKQLSALMEKRPWWQALPQLLSSRAYLPVGATAILAFTLVSVKFYSPAQISQIDDSIAVSQARVSADNSAEIAVPAMSPQVSSPLVNRSESVEQPAAALAVLTAASTAMPVAGDQVEVPMLTSAQPVETPSARSIAANLARLEQSEPELLKAVMGDRLSSPSRVQVASAPVAELASVSTGSSKRSRLLAQYSDRILEPEPVAPEIVRERLSRRLGDSELNDRITRVGLRGDQVSLKF